MAPEDYHATKALSASGLRELVRSPRHYFAANLDPQRPADEPTAAMQAGTLLHCLALEPEEFERRYVVRPEGVDLRTKAGKAWAEAVPAGAVVIKAEDERTARLQVAALHASPELAKLLADGVSESSAFWTAADDEGNDVPCKCRPDRVSPAGDGVILTDLKTCPDASPAGFARSVWTHRYDLQAAWYSDGYEAATGQKVHGFVFGAVESAWPHLAGAYLLPDEVLDRARTECRRLLNLYALCTRTDNWPGYPSGIQLINLPAWANKEQAA